MLYSITCAAHIMLQGTLLVLATAGEQTKSSGIFTIKMCVEKQLTVSSLLWSKLLLYVEPVVCSCLVCNTNTIDLDTCVGRHDSMKRKLTTCIV